MVWLLVVNFGYSWGPCGRVVISELWPLSNRAYGIALGAFSNWMSNFIMGQITPTMLQKITFGTFIFSGLLTFGGGAFIWLFVPETKRLTLEEMDVLFGSTRIAEADSRRMAEFNKEIGLEDVLRGMGMGIGRTDAGGEVSGFDEDDKKGGVDHDHDSKETEGVG